MRLPFVSRLRLEFTQAENERLKAEVTDLKAANAKLLELVEAEKEARRDDRLRAEEEPDETASRRQRMFGTDVMRKATQWAQDHSAKKGQTR